MTDRKTYRLVHQMARNLAVQAVRAAPQGHVVTIRPATRSLEQNAKLHAMFDDIARAGFEWGGEKRNAEEVKAPLMSAHAAATQSGFDLVKGIEGELVQLRESTASMSKARSSSLIEYVTAFCATRGIPLREPA